MLLGQDVARLFVAVKDLSMEKEWVMSLWICVAMEKWSLGSRIAFVLNANEQRWNEAVR